MEIKILLLRCGGLSVSVAVAPTSYSPPFFDAALIRVMKRTFSSLQARYQTQKRSIHHLMTSLIPQHPCCLRH